MYSSILEASLFWGYRLNFGGKKPSAEDKWECWNFTVDTYPRYRAIVGWACFVSFLINRCNISLLPDVWETLLAEGGLEE